MFSNQHMKSISARTLLALMVVVISLPSVVLATETVSLVAATPVICEFVETLDASLATAGQNISMRVVYDVVADGAVVIKAGAPAFAQVTNSHPSGAIGKPAAITLAINNVMAVDGTRIPVTGMKSAEGENKQTDALVVTILCCILGLIMKGGDTQIEAGTQVTVTTVGEAAISIQDDPGVD